MDSLTKIISHLKASEIQFIRHFYGFKKTKNFEKRGQLFDLIVKGKVKSNEDGMRLIFKTVARSAFSQMKSQLKKELYDVLVLHESTIKSSLDSDTSAFENTKSLLAIEILRDRKLTAAVEELEHKLLDDCRAKEMPVEASVLLHGSHNPIDCYLSPLHTHDHLIKMQEIATEVQVLHDSASAWFRSTMPCHRKDERDIAIEQICSKTLPELRAALESSGSIRVERYYHQLGFQCAFYGGDIPTARQHWIALAESVSKPLFAPDNTKVCLVAFRCLLLCESGELDSNSEALNDLEKAFLTYQGEGIELIEQLFFLARSKSLWCVALRLTEIMENLSILEDYPAILGRWVLYKAGILLQSGLPAECFRILRQTDQPFRSFEGAFVSSAILELMCLIELENDDGIENRFEAFSKMVRRRKQNAEGIDQARVKLILSAFKTLIQEAYNFDTAKEKCHTILATLNDGSTEHEWDEFGQEVIEFNTWFNYHLTLTSP